MEDLEGSPVVIAPRHGKIEEWEKPFAHNFRGGVRPEEELNRDNLTVILNSPGPNEKFVG